MKKLVLWLFLGIVIFCVLPLIAKIGIFLVLGGIIWAERQIK